MSEAAASTAQQVNVGDILEGTGTHHVRVEVLSIDGPNAQCRLVRSGREKTIALRTLQSAYALIQRADVPTGG